MDFIIDVRFRYADAETYVEEGMDTLLPRWKKNMEGKERLELSQAKETFYLFVFQFDGIMVNKDEVVLATFSWLMAAKTEEPIFHIKG